METIQNDSPRQPVWRNPASLSQAMRHLEEQRTVTAADTRRCICGAKPNPNGTLPCDH